MMMNVMVDWYTNLHTVDNGGNGSSLEYQRGHFLEALKSVKQERLVLRSLIFLCYMQIIPITKSLKPTISFADSDLLLLARQLCLAFECLR